jgi:NAD(P)-dependent dehydrogenase (short-subunit alcohol dehydrogenase family)
MATKSKERSIQTHGAILISGAASGLGSCFLHHYAASESKRIIIAIDRLPPLFPKRFENTDHIKTYVVNVTDAEQIEALVTELQDIPISLIIHCAGVRGLVPSVVRSKPGDVAAAETLGVMDQGTMNAAFNINCVGTLLLVQALLPNLRKYSQENQDRSDYSPPRCVILGSRMGSISANMAGGGYAYRASKAALNAVVRSLSIDVQEVIFAVLHPGRVETGLVEWKEEGAIRPEESIVDCLKVIDNLTPKDTGSFLDRFGQKIDW